MLNAIRAVCSASLRTKVNAVIGYETFAALVDAAFRTLCSVSHSLGSQPLTPKGVKDHPMLKRYAQELPHAYLEAAERVAEVTADVGLEQRLGQFAIPRSSGELVELVLQHHELTQAAKPPEGKRSWFEPLRDGWVVRGPYGRAEQPTLGTRFVHPVRVAPLHRFMRETA